MALEFTQIVDPIELTTGLAIMITVLLSIIVYTAYRLRSPLVFFMWGLSITVLIFTFIAGMDFIWFWIMIIMSAFTITIASTIRYTYYGQ